MLSGLGLLLLMTTGFPTWAQSDEAMPTTNNAAESMVSSKYLCELQNLKRRIEIDYHSTNSSTPCSVNYYKDTEAPGEINTLWKATSTEGYCEGKAAEFVRRLAEWGWACSES